MVTLVFANIPLFNVTYYPRRITFSDYKNLENK